VAKKKFDLREVLEDIRQGFGDVPVMEKHGLDPAQLEVIKRKWGHSLPKQADPLTETLTGIERRGVPRREPLYQIAVYEQSNPRNKGLIGDIHVKGLRVIGIMALLNELKTLTVPSEPFKIHLTFTFQAQCCWSMINDYGECEAGFRITDISREAMMEMKKLLNTLTIMP